MSKLINRTGHNVGRLTVLRRDNDYISPKGEKKTRWLCECDCGKKVSLFVSSLKRGQKSCGHCNDIYDGDKFGRLEVLCGTIPYIDCRSKHSSLQVICLCDCGNYLVVVESSLKNGDTTSCGCYHNEQSYQRWTGVNHPNWHGGITSLYDQIRNSTQYKKWRTDVFERDNYTCQYSNQLGKGDLNAHHKKPFHQILEENNITTLEQALACEELWDVENGITLSEEFHSQTSNNPMAFHRIYGTNNCTKQNFYCWMPSCLSNMENIS